MNDYLMFIFLAAHYKMTLKKMESADRAKDGARPKP
jgi:hypothetical protein